MASWRITRCEYKRSEGRGNYIKRELREYPSERFDETIVEKLPTVIKMRAPIAKDA